MNQTKWMIDGKVVAEGDTFTIPLDAPIGGKITISSPNPFHHENATSQVVGMTRDDIIRMMLEAGIDLQSHTGVTGHANVTTCGSQRIEKIERLIELAVAAEREACALICDDLPAWDIEAVNVLKQAAKDIRARGTP